MSEDVPMQYVVVRDPDLQQLAAGAANASRTTSTTLFMVPCTGWEPMSLVCLH